MEREVYEDMAEHDERHWWYRARRRVVAELIRRKVPLPKDAKLLEIGCGTGHNLPMLGEFGQVDALEVDPIARGMAEKRLGRTVLSSPLPALEGALSTATRPAKPGGAGGGLTTLPAPAGSRPPAGTGNGKRDS